MFMSDKIVKSRNLFSIESKQHMYIEGEGDSKILSKINRSTLLFAQYIWNRSTRRH